ncbi:hypothetical protein TNCV_3568421 [Trichonephila clavipes]|nr:hypothetical protein TNCV_3568421 [Trichonephila clavipes]
MLKRVIVTEWNTISSEETSKLVQSMPKRLTEVLRLIRTTPELLPPSRNFQTTPMGGHLSIDIFNVHRPSLHGGSSAVLGSSS